MIERLWDALKRRCCVHPDKATRCVMVERKDLDVAVREAGSCSLEMVREFMESFEQTVQDRPNLGNVDLNKLRERLISEESVELGIALEYQELVEAFDALLDLQYVLDGAFLALGFGGIKDDGMREVHRSNMSKLGADGKPIIREDGKVLKGPNYTKPDLWPIVKRALEGGAK